ncbi:MAG TPA: RNA-binding S4 domain-containing protein [Candidatus Omnitrophota bacterium]|nr:RNA-binding S4 domain-containing protein [Candidatus Omnitrophota bacterium]HPT07705.1 RNA-binding S4 domain-containing protein [Candidatus Omnitrophota bacterium]
MEFKLLREFIELDNMLKASNLVANGAEAKQQIVAGAAKVNGEIESRVRRKLRAGDVVEFKGNTVNVVA